MCVSGGSKLISVLEVNPGKGKWRQKKKKEKDKKKEKRKKGGSSCESQLATQHLVS